MPSSPRGFTLIELLVVITIIVVLLALLTPGLDRAISAASSAVCASNLRLWSVATRQYSLDHKGAKLRFVTSPRNYWWAPLAPYMGEEGYARRPLGTLVLKANLCPEAPMRPGEGIDVPGGVSVQVGGTGYSTGSKWGSARKAWEWGASTVSGGPPLADTAYASYGFNLWVTENDLNSVYENAYEPGYFYGRYSGVPGNVPLVGDCNWVGAWPDHNDLPPQDTENGNASASSGWDLGGLMGRYVLDRHSLGGMAINLAYVDGSAINTRLGDLWQQPWHQKFERTDAYQNDYD